MNEMAKGDWWFKFEIPAWRNSPELRKCSLETRGFWIECIAIMKDTDDATITGSYQDFARAVGCFPEEAERCISELKRNKTADVTLRNSGVTVKSRKYARELKVKEQTRLRVAKLRSNANVTQEKRTSVKSKEKEVREEEIREGDPPVGEVATKRKKERDSRIDHPAIKMVHEIMALWPHKDLWNRIIREIGEEPNQEFFIKCYELWRSVNGNKTNLEKWLFDPAKTGMPPEVYGAKNGSNGTKEHPNAKAAREWGELRKTLEGE